MFHDKKGVIMYMYENPNLIDFSKLGQNGGTTSGQTGGTNNNSTMATVVYNNTSDMDQYLAIFAN